MGESLSDRLAPYIPTDRLHAMAARVELPAKQAGSVLLVDISGFTPLTELLVRELGARRGGEELTGHLNLVYGALIGEVRRWRGSVVGFSGDAIACWFADDDGVIAASCGLRMQRSMEPFRAIATSQGATSRIAIKVAVASGVVRRFVVGDPALHVVDVLCGSMLDRVARAEALAKRGDVVVGAEVVAAAGDRMTVAGWAEPDRFALVDRLADVAEPVGWPAIDVDALAQDQLRLWLLPAVYDRLRSGQGHFLAELRQAVALFVRFSGLDFERDDAVGEKLQAYICWVQSVLQRHEGALIQVTTGDKGSYLYAAFGAPVAHEDDSSRAMAAALVLREPPASVSFITRSHVGVSRGQMRTGAYGSTQRRTYGVLGDETNVAARLMSMATSGQVLVTEPIVRACSTRYQFESLGAVALKGKNGPVPIFELHGLATSRTQRRRRTREPIIGRDRERAVLHAAIDQLHGGETGHTIVLEGEPGIGKSRLVGDLLDRARSKSEPPIRCLIASATAIDAAVPYFVWRELFARCFELDDSLDHALARSRILERLPPALVPLAPLLNAVLPFELAETPVTLQLQDLRVAQTRRYLAQVFHALTGTAPVVVVIEDAHFVDSSSWALLELIRQQSPRLLVALTMRPQSTVPEPVARLRQLPTTHSLPLPALLHEEVVALVGQRLGVASLPAEVATLVCSIAEGNPLFAEELGDALRDAGVIRIEDGACRVVSALDALPFPDTIEGIVTSRIDRLPPSEQLALKVASVVGRTFRIAPVQDAFPVIAERHQVPDLLAALVRLGLTTSDDASDPVFSFKHGISADVAYNLMLFEQRRGLHHRVADWYEHAVARDPSAYAIVAHHRVKAIDGLAQPDARSLMLAVDALLNAGKRTMEAGATPEAIAHLSMARTLIDGMPRSRERDAIELDLCSWLGAALAVVRGPMHDDVRRELTRARTLCREIEDPRRLFETLFSQWRMNMAGSERDGALEFSAQLLGLADETTDPWLQMSARHARGATLVSTGEHTEALALIGSSLALAGEARASAAALSHTRDPVVLSHCYSGISCVLLGWSDQAVAHTADAIRIATQTAHPHNRMQALGFAAVIQRYRRDVAATEHVIGLASALAAEHEFPYWNMIIAAIQAWIAMQRGDVAAAVAQLERIAAADRQSAAFPLIWIVVRADLIAGLTALKRFDDALAIVAEAKAQAGVRLLDFGMAEIHHLEGELWRQRSEDVEARECLVRARDLARAQHARALELRAQLSLARLDPAELEPLKDLYRGFTEGFETPDVVAARTLTKGALDRLRSGSCDLEAVWDYVLGRLATELSPKLTYHRLEHTRDDVVPAVIRLAAMEGLSTEDTALLVTATLFHDLGFVERRDGHEAVSERVARDVLPRFGYSARQIETVAGIIRATKLPQSPRSLLEELMADADLDMLGRNDFMVKNEALRVEWANFGDAVDRERWYVEQLGFLRAHRYFGRTANDLRARGKAENIAEMERRLALLRKSS